MTRETARIDIATAIQAAAAAFPNYPVIVDYENKALIDYAAQDDPYLAVDIVYYDGKQMDLGPNPMVGTYGRIVLAVCVQDGRGTSKANVLMDYFSHNLQLKKLFLVQTEIARPQPSVDRKGWYCLVTMINFWYHLGYNSNTEGVLLDAEIGGIAAVDLSAPAVLLDTIINTTLPTTGYW